MKLLLLALVPACFAFNPVAGRAMVDAFGPATLTLVRWSLSGLVIGTLALMRPGYERWQAPLSHLLQLAVPRCARHGLLLHCRLHRLADDGGY
jgi:hypothetical protein